MGMIILDEKEECYEIADGQQRLTTMLLSLISIYNHYQGSRKEQSVLNNYIFDKEMNIRLQNDSVGSYISSDNGSGLLEVDIEDDKDVYNQKNVFKTAYATIDAILSENDRFKEFKDKLQNSTLLVLIKDIDSTNSDAVEQIFLDINEKSKRLDNASIFKGYCFKIYDEAFQDELKCLWIRLKKAYISFKNFSGENYKFDEYIYMYLLVTEDENMTENLSPGGIHFLEDKNMDDVERILTKMVEYGERVSDFYKHIQNEAYIFEDICVPDNRNAKIKWLTKDEESIEISFTGQSERKKKLINYLIVEQKLNNDILLDFDVIKKIELISDYYGNATPKHVGIITAHIENMESYKELKKLKNEEDEKEVENIRNCYNSFLDEYFSDNNQRTILNKLLEGLKLTFINS